MIPTSTQAARIGVDLAQAVARISLRQPPLNIIDIGMMEELAQVLAEIETRSDITALVVCGAGKGFSAGVDVAAHTPDKVGEMLTKFHAVIRAFVSTRKITIAAVHGHCLGGGAELAMVCDMVYTTEDAQWGFPEIRLGCYPPVACAALAALVGQKRAAELILTGHSISGKEAAEIGLATLACPGDPSSAVEERLGQLSHLSSCALAITKKAFYAWDSIHFDKGLARAEKTYFEELMKTADAEEGIRAFMEKRPPRWNGR